MAERRSPSIDGRLDIRALGLIKRGDDARFEDLTRALRSRDLAGSIYALDAWAESNANLEYLEDSDDLRNADRKTLELTRWVRREVRLHVVDGRFQHALVLVERYAIPPVPLDRISLKRLEKARSNSL